MTGEIRISRRQSRRVFAAVILLALCLVTVPALGCTPHKEAASTTSETYVLGGLDPALAGLIGEARATGLQIGAVATWDGELTMDVITQPNQPVSAYEAIAQKLLPVVQKYKNQLSLKVDLLHVRVAWSDTSQHSYGLYNRYFQLNPPAPQGSPSVKVSLSLVAANTVKIGEIWIRVAQAGGFLAETANPDTMELDFSPSGSLVHLLIVARTADQRTVTVGWDGTGGPDDQRVNVTGVVEKGAATSPLRTEDSVSKIALAIDEVGIKNMLAFLRGVSPGGYYALKPVLHDGSTMGGSISMTATAYRWEGTKFVSLPADDQIRLGNPPYFILEMTPIDGSLPGPGVAGDPTAPLVPVFFAIPVPSI